MGIRNERLGAMIRRGGMNAAPIILGIPWRYLCGRKGAEPRAKIADNVREFELRIDQQSPDKVSRCTDKNQAPGNNCCYQEFTAYSPRVSKNGFFLFRRHGV